MKRKIIKSMEEWKKNSASKTALLIEGARRIGKSYIAEEFAKKNYKSYIMIDFNKASHEIKELFDNGLEDLDNLFANLSAIYNTQLYEHDSVIILDEIQLCTQARAAIKFLVADGRYHYIETGSLLSIKENTKDIVIPSEERHIKMYPMDFEEFLWALSEEQIVSVIKEKFEKKEPMGNALHRRAMTLFRQYIIVGGMPQAINEFIETKNYERVNDIKKDILFLYRQDISKYAKGYEQKIEIIFDEIPEQLSKHEKKYRLSDISKDARYRNYESSFMWLEDSMICNICYNSTEPNIGIKLNRDRNTMKIYMGDTGLLLTHTFDENKIGINEIYEKIIFGKLDLNEGMVFENVVAQMLVCSGHKLYFYSKSSRENKDDRMEIDFLITTGLITNKHNISPVEVKSGKRYTYTSLNKFKKKYNVNLDKSYIIHTLDLKIEDDKVFLPVYMTGLL